MLVLSEGTSFEFESATVVSGVEGESERRSDEGSDQGHQNEHCEDFEVEDSSVETDVENDEFDETLASYRGELR